ncbi:GSCOCG00008459001-RA-CDS [Cotesia congregata]|uniref:F-box domain-containing protein n=1 Tax=Cotesia congregata TaxID=51543 RepID=A0A8J2HLP0_COTCN|nr:GSCOCG00008459001-RA-CDS [Cotesia congregata]CAG5107667.1 Protein of unknown function [Cotesia congregata]
MNSLPIESTDIFIPDHVWPDILKHISPLKLFVLRRTCKYFKDIIEEMFEKNSTWKDLCLNSSIKPWIWKIQEKLFPYAEKYTTEKLDKTWKDVFYSYKYWRAYSKRRSKFITLNLRNNSVNYNYVRCSDAFGNYFTIASDRGVVFLFIINDQEDDLSNSINLLHTFTNNHNVIYRQLKFWNAEGNIFLAVTSPAGNLTLFNIDSQTIHDNLLINAWTRSQTLSRGTDHKLMIGSAINVIYQLTWNETPENVNIKPINIGDAYEDLWWPVKSLCCQYEKTTIALKYQSTSRVSFDNGDLKITKRMDPYFDPPPRKIYIPIPEVVIFNEGRSLVVVVLNDSNQVRIKRHYLLKHIKSKIVSVVMHVNMLFLGTSSGNIYLFVLKDIQQLVDENLNQLPIIQVLSTSNEPILTLDITEVKKEPYIIAFTKSNLHVVKI